MNKVIWKPIEEWNNLYFVSNMGEVWSVRAEKVIAPKLKKSGTLRIDVSINNRKCYAELHHLVAKAFIPNPNNYKVVGFLDGDKTNCEASNLFWMKKHVPIMTKRVHNITHDIYFDSVAEAAAAYGVKTATLSLCLHGKTKKCARCEWEIVE